MKVSGFEFFKPSGKNALLGISCLLVPMVVLGYFVKNSRDELEASYRRGEVAYKDRRFKFAS